MKSIYEYVTATVNEEASYKSSIIQSIVNPLVLKSGSREPDMPDWSKIEDNDLTEIGYYEAYNNYKKYNGEKPYIIWVSDRTWGVEDGKIALVTWGAKVIWCAVWDRVRRDASVKRTIQEIDCQKAYILKDPEKFIK